MRKKYIGKRTNKSVLLISVCNMKISRIDAPYLTG